MISYGRRPKKSGTFSRALCLGSELGDRGAFPKNNTFILNPGTNLKLLKLILCRKRSQNRLTLIIKSGTFWAKVHWFGVVPLPL